jgi:hypothetical protein
MPTLPKAILAHLLPFRVIFLTQKTFIKASLLIIGALMCQGARTICSLLRILGLKGETTFTKYHNVLNRSKWDILKGAKILLQEIDKDKSEPLKIVVDGHLERRKGAKIKARGHYRDAVQSSDNYTVISSGLKWLSVMALKRYSWCTRTLALPFLTALVPSEDGNKTNNRKHKTLQTWTCQIIMQIRRWFPDRTVFLIADNEFATAGIALQSIKHSISFISRLKLNARLFDFPFRNLMGRPRNKGLRLPSIVSMLADPSITWISKKALWYGGKHKEIEFITGTCLWHVMTHSQSPIPIRYVLLRDPAGKFKPVLLMSTGMDLDAVTIIESYVERWNIEVTFHEAREHLGIETQRQWSDMAIARSTPILFALYSLSILIGKSLMEKGLIHVENAAWYAKDEIKLSDILTGIRKHILEEMYFCKRGVQSETLQKCDENLISRIVDLFLHAA